MPVFLQGRRAFCIIPAPPTSPLPPFPPRLASPVRASLVRASPTHAVPAPLPPPVTPTLTSPPPLLLPPATPFLTLPTSLPPPSDTEAPHGTHLSHSVRTAARSALLLPSCPRHRHGPRPFSGSARDPRPGPEAQKKADGTAQRSVRRQKATNLSRQHHRGRSSGSPENRLF